MDSPLSIPEELFLLTVDQHGGSLSHTETPTFRIALSSAILMELALKHKIDTNVDEVIIENTDPTGSEILDLALNDLQLVESGQSIRHWMNHFEKKAETFVFSILNNLIKLGILKIENQKILWVFNTNRYPVIDDQEIQEVKSRIFDLIMSDDIPDLRDMVIVSLLYYSSMVKLVLTDEQIESRGDRLKQIAKMDLIGQSIGKRLEDEMAALLIASRPYFA